MRKYLVLFIILISAFLLSAYATRDDIEVEDDWYMNYIDADRPVAYDSLIYLFMLKGGGAYDTVRIVDTLRSVTFFADTGFNVRSHYINMGDIATNSVTGLYSFACGLNDTVTGDGSNTFGGLNLITGDYSFGVGYLSGLLGDYSFASGYSVTGSADYSVMFGSVINDSADYSFCGCYHNTTHSGARYSFSWGYNNFIYTSTGTRNGHGSFGLGYADTLCGRFSGALGTDINILTNYSYGLGSHITILGDSTNTNNFILGTGVIDSTNYAFLIGDAIADILARPHTFSVMLDTNDLNGYTEIGDSVVVDQDGDVWGIDSIWANYFIGNISGASGFPVDSFYIQCSDSCVTGWVFGDDTIYVDTSKTDSADVAGWNFANYGYAGTFTETQTIDIDEVGADTGLVIRMDSTNGHSDEAVTGLIIRGTAFKDATQRGIEIYDRNEINVIFYTDANGDAGLYGHMYVGKNVMCDYVVNNSNTNLGVSQTENDELMRIGTENTTSGMWISANGCQYGDTTTGVHLTNTDLTVKGVNTNCIGSITSSVCDTVASAATITLGTFNNFVITGTADIDSIDTDGAIPNWCIAYIQFTGSSAFFGVVDGKNLKIAGNFAYTADDILVIQRRGDLFYEMSRSAN